MPFNQVHDKVYIRDAHLEWLPGIVLNIDDDRALVCIDLPADWDETTVLHNRKSYSYDQLHHQQRWVLLKDYYNRQLPLQNNHGLCRNMAELTQLHDAEMLYQMKARFSRSSQNPYTRVGDIMVAINSGGKSVNGLYSIDRQIAYAKKYLSDASSSLSQKKSTNEEKKEEICAHDLHNRNVELLTYEPHVYEISSLAYKNIISPSNNKKQQTIILLGESGSGKTETGKLLLQHLAFIPSLLSHDKGASLQLQPGQEDLIRHVIESSQILEAFGNAKTNHHVNSSRFCKVMQLQYSVGEKQSLLSASVEAYMLEASRLVSTASLGESNFHIFYQFLSASKVTKLSLLGEHWADASLHDFRYLSAASSAIVDSSCHMSYANEWEKTLSAIKLFCWDDVSLRMLIQALGIILRLGNIVFDMNSKGEAVVSPRDDLVLLAQEMELPLVEIEHVLTGRSIVTASQETIRVAYTVGSAIEARDALAKAIYAGLFSSVVRQINLLTCSPSSHFGAISLVDIFGFEFMQLGQFQQLCINYVNERVHQKYFNDIISRYKFEFDKEDIELPEWKDVDNSRTLDLLEGSSGIIPLLKKQTICLNGSSETFVLELKALNKKNGRPIHEKNHKPSEFFVQHFAGTITYDGRKFVECNRESLPEDLIGLWAKCSNPLISQELLKLVSSSNKNISLDSFIAKKNSSNSTVLDKVEKQLLELIQSLEKSESHYIKCIKPTEISIETRQIEHSTVLRQLRYAGLVVAVELTRDTFSHKLPFQIVEKMFSCLIDGNSRKNIKDMELHDRVQIMMSILFAPIIEQYRDSDFSMPFACGKTKVFFRHGAFESLEAKRIKLLASMATRIQKWSRKVIMKRMYKDMQGTIVKLQAIVRMHPVRQRYLRDRQSAVKIQAAVISKRDKNSYLRTKQCTIEIQHWYRAQLMKQRFKNMSQAATTVCIWRRAQTHRNALVRKRWLTTMIPIYLEAMNKLKCYDEKKRLKLRKTIQQTDCLFPHRIPFKLLEERFICLIPPNSLKPMEGMEEKDKSQLMMLILFSPFIEECRINKNFPMPFACGKTRVYFRPGSLEVLEILRREHYTIPVIKLQKWIRRVAVQQEYQNMRRAIIQVQNCFRARNSKNATLAVLAYAHVLQEMGYTNPSHKAALTRALENSKKIFPNKMSYFVANDRFSLVVPHKYKRSIYDMYPSDKTKYILSIIFTPFVEHYKNNNLPMPFSCRETGLFLRTGTLDVLEILRKERLGKSIIKIQSWMRSKMRKQKYRNLLMAILKVQRLCRGYVRKMIYFRARKSVIVIQQWVRKMLQNRKERLKRQAAAATIVSACRLLLTYRQEQKERERSSAQTMTSWARSLILRNKYKQARWSAIRLQAHYRRKRTMKVCQDLNKDTHSARPYRGYRKAHRLKTLRNGPRRVRDDKADKYKEEKSDEKIANITKSPLEDKMHPWNEKNTRLCFDQKTNTMGQDIITDMQAGNLRISKPLEIFSNKHTVDGVTRSLQLESSGTTSEFIEEKESELNGIPDSEDALFQFDLSEISLNESIYESSHASDQSIAPASDLVKLDHLWAYDSEPENYEDFNEHARKRDETHSSQTRDPAPDSSFPSSKYTDQGRILSSIARLDDNELSNFSPDRSLNQNCAKDTFPLAKGSNLDSNGFFENSPVKGIYARSSFESFLEKEKFYKKQVESLRNDIMQVTTEAEIHNQEIEAEYEERLAAYEAEVLQLQQSMENLEQEKAALKKKYTLAKESYEEDVKNLKEAMKRAEDSHRKYLRQVMASVDKSKVENEKAIENLKNRNESRIRQLEDIIEGLKQNNGQNYHQKNQHITGKVVVQEAHRLAQKLEKIVSPQHIIKICEMFRGDTTVLSTKVESKISYKARNIVGRLERMVVASSSGPQMINVIAEEAEKEIKNLEQQLVMAYEEIEMLENELTAIKRMKNKDSTSRRRRKFF